MTPSEEQLAFYHGIGVAVTQWAHVENALYQVLYTCFDNRNHGELSTAFFSVENFRSKHQMADNVVSRKFRDSPNLSDWRALHDRIRSASAVRNALAHYWVLVYPDEKPGRQYGLLPRMGNSRKAPPKRSQKVPAGSLFVREIAQFGRRFSSLSKALTNFAARLGGHQEPFPKSLEQEARPMTLAQLKRQIHAMLGLPQKSFRP
jgi:hypothetical protein